MIDVDELTVVEIAGILGEPFQTIKSRIALLGIEPVRKVGRTNIYAPSVVDKLKNPRPVGRPRKQAESPDK